jgi:hypothetical protein
MQIIVAMRGRDKENPNHRGKANENYQQRLEPNEWGGCNTISTVQKDNLVLEIYEMENQRKQQKRL